MTRPGRPAGANRAVVWRPQRNDERNREGVLIAFPYFGGKAENRAASYEHFGDVDQLCRAICSSLAVPSGPTEIINVRQKRSTTWITI